MSGPVAERMWARIAKLPRVSLARLPTPIEPLLRLQEELGCGALFVLRDDCTSVGLGGNKVRQLELYLGEARHQRADTVLITGAVQSNFATLTAACARRLGLHTIVQLEDRVPTMADEPSYRGNGNVLLEQMFGAEILEYPEGEDEAGADRRLREVADELRARGRRPYQIPLAPGPPPLGALGYVLAARELAPFLVQHGVEEVIVGSGSGHTHGGLLFGLRALGYRGDVVGVCVRRSAEPQRARIRERCREIAVMLEVSEPVTTADVLVDDRFLAPGYGRCGAEALEALALLARCEALLVDPVYTSKSFACLIARARERPARVRLVVHTGGLGALFAYPSVLTPYLASVSPPPNEHPQEPSGG